MLIVHTVLVLLAVGWMNCKLSVWFWSLARGLGLQQGMT